jgi:hypothetical protein
MKLGEWLNRHVTGYPWIERVHAVTLQPGDLLVVQVASGARRSDLETIRAQLAEVVPEGVRGVVLSGDTRIDVVRTVDPSLRPLAGGPFSREGEGA